jgi:hypothetical protein
LPIAHCSPTDQLSAEGKQLYTTHRERLQALTDLHQQQIDAQKAVQLAEDALTAELEREAETGRSRCPWQPPIVGGMAALNGPESFRPGQQAARGCTRPVIRQARGSWTPQATSRPCRSFPGHSSIQTTGDIYADWDIDQLAATMTEVLASDESFQSSP